jgi:hypothetical protein
MRRRTRWRLLDATFMLLMMWYSLHVRYRVLYIGERPAVAMTPTTFLIYRSTSPNVPNDLHETLIERLFHHNAAEPQVQAWQVWSQSWATYYAIKADPPTTLRDQRMTLLHRLTYHSGTANRNWHTLMYNASPPLQDIMLNDMASPRSAHLRDPQVRRFIWHRYYSNTVTDPQLASYVWMHTSAYVSLSTDNELLREAQTLTHVRAEDIQAPYLDEIERRRLSFDPR